jgi:cell division protein YceG involved in septum cleavage
VLADEEGGHAFAVTLAEHEANVQKALEAGLL